MRFSDTKEDFYMDAAIVPFRFFLDGVPNTVKNCDCCGKPLDRFEQTFHGCMCSKCRGSLPPNKLGMHLGKLVGKLYLNPNSDEIDIILKQIKGLIEADNKGMNLISYMMKLGDDLKC